MKIGIITDAIDDSAAGIGVYVKNLVLELSKIDKKNTYVLIHYKKNNFYNFIKNKNFKEEIISLKKENLFYRFIRKFFILPIKIQKLKLDVLHETTQVGSWFFLSRFKKVITVHDLVPLILPKTQPFFSYITHKFLVNFLLKKYDHIISVSKNTKKDLTKILKIPQDKIKVVYEDANILSTKKYMNKKPKNFFLFVGTLEPRKNIVRLLKAFSKFNKKKTHFKLIIIGKKGWKYEDIFKTYKNLKLKGKVIILNKVSDKELNNYFCNAFAFIFPSLYEGFGLPVLEAMKLGCPVIASKTSSIPEITENSALLIDPYSVESICYAMLKITNELNTRKILIKKGREQAKKFSWKKCAKQTLQVYTS